MKTQRLSKNKKEGGVIRMLRLEIKGITSIIAAIGLLCLVLLLMPNSAFAGGSAASQTSTWTDSAATTCATDPPADGATETIVATIGLTADNKGGVSLNYVPITVNNAGSLVTGDITQVCVYSAGANQGCQSNPVPGTTYNLYPTDQSKASTYTVGIIFSATSGGHSATVTVGDFVPLTGVASANVCGDFTNEGINDCVALPQTTSTCTASTPNQRPTVASLAQKNSEGTAIGSGNYSNGTTRDTVILEAVVSDNEGDNVQLFAEYRTSPATWTAANCGPSASAAPGTHSVTCTGIPDGAYDWQVWASDAGGAGTAVGFGGSNNDPDFRIDNNAPATIADLAAPSSTVNSVDLTWSNPSDGAGSGNASFDVRYRVGSTFVEGDWASASQATGEPTPPTTGMTVGSLSCGTTYTFAIKTTDNEGLTSVISNAATRATSACPGDEVTIDTFANLAPASTSAGTNDVQMLSFFIYVSSSGIQDDQATLDQIVIDDLGTAPDTDVGLVEVWLSANNTCCTGPDTQIGTGTFSGGSVTINVTDQTIDTGGDYIFIIYDIAGGAGGGNTLQTDIADNTSIILSSAGDTVVASAGGSSNSMSITAAATDTATIADGTDNTPATVDQGQTDVKMLTFSLITDNADDGTMNFTSLKVDKTGTVLDADVTAVKAYWSADATCTTGDTQLGSTGTFSGGTHTFSGFSQAINTTKSYVCVFYSISGTADDTKTVGASIADQTYVTVSESKNAWGGVSSATPADILVAAACDKTIDNCMECHGDSDVPTMAPSDGTRDWTTGAVIGDHGVGSHVPPTSPTEADCAVCHEVPAGDLKHRNGIISMNATGIKGGWYDKNNDQADNDDTFPQDGSTTATCSSTSCHGTASPQWGVGKVYCDSCHKATTGGGAGTELDGAHSLHYNSTDLPTNRDAVNKSITNSTTYMFNCGYCHNVDPTSKHLNESANTGNNVDVIFNIAMSPWTSGVYTVGVDNTTSNPSDSGYRWWFDGRCNNVYCHSNVQNNSDGASAPNLYGSPLWGQTGPLGCAACHGSPPSSGSHAAHVNAGFSDCTICHVEFVYGQPAHVNGVIDVVINTSSYGGSATYSQGKNNPGTGYGTCSNNSCHDNALGTLLTTPTWGTAISDCQECHPTQPSSGSHTAHLNDGAACGNCHDGAVQGSTSPSQHLDGNIDVYDAASGDLGYTPNKPKGGSGWTCDNAYCHDKGRGGLVTTPTWGTSPAQCSECHEVQPTTGSHTKHLNNNATCGNCHDGAQQGSTAPSGGQHRDGNIDVFDAASGDLGYTPNKPKNSAFGTCNNAYCHDDGTGTKVTTPTWGNTGGCNSCHNAVPSTGSHTAHLNDGALCGNCHDGAVQNSSNSGASHTDGNIDVFDAASGDLGYTPNKPKNTPYWTCDNAYCHDKGRGGLAVTPTWGTSPAQCSECHEVQPTTGSHQAHLTTVKKPVGAPVCSDCHDGTIQGSSAPSGVHRDGDIDVFNVSSGDLGYTPNKPKNSAFGTCNNAYCHDDGTGKVTSPTWGSSPGECSECHQAAPSTGSHTKHLDSGALCGNCHDGAIQGSSVSGNAHLDGNIDVFDMTAGDLGYTANKAKGTAGDSCDNAYCHDDGTGTKVTTPTWGSTSTCGECHAAVPTTNSHSIHLGYSGNIACGNCHDGAIQSSTDTGGQHRDGNVDVYDVSAGDLGYTANKAKGTATDNCTNINCHGGASTTWGGNTTARDACTQCHGTKTNNTDGTSEEYLIAPPNDTSGHTSATDPEVGAHRIHLRSSASTAPIVNFDITCNTCHNKPSSVFQAGHLDAALSWDGSADISFSTFVSIGGANPSYSGGTCNNTYCHNENFMGTAAPGPGNHVNGAGDVTPSWNDTTYQSGSNPRSKGTTNADCDQCHAYDGSDCQSCHDHVNGSNNGFDTGGGGLADHIDGSLQASGGGCMGCHSNPKGDRFIIVGGTAGSEGDDFIRQSSHVYGGGSEVVTDSDCAVCHMEGANACDGSYNSTYHTLNPGPVDLRNVDTRNLAVSWPGWREPTHSWTATKAQRRGMDTFCMSCHDSNGADGISVVGAGGSCNVSNGQGDTTPFNSGSSLDNGHDGLSGVRTAITNVKDQFDPSNRSGSWKYSHHNLEQFTRRYSSNNAGWPAALWTTYVTKNESASDGGGSAINANGLREQAGLHCSDCHLNEENAHGSRNAPYMLGDETHSDTAFTVSTENCFLCHNKLGYDGQGGLATKKGGLNTRVQAHNNGDASRCNNSTEADNKYNIACLNCHAGWPQGAIHGYDSSSDTYNAWNGSAVPRYRFMSGAVMQYYSPDGAASPIDSDWTGTANFGCYTNTGTFSTGSCNQHSSGYSGQTSNFSRPLNY